MTFDPLHGHAALRRGRWSESGAEYFLTFCTAERQPGLTAPVLFVPILEEAGKLTQESVWDLRTMVIMPDHIHLLVTITHSSGLAGAVRHFKGRLSPVIRKFDLVWQKAYFDHRLRSNEDTLPIFLCIFLNPYRAGLVSVGEPWPGYYCSPADWTWFGILTDQACPYPAWLA